MSLGMGQEKYKVSLKHLVVPETKEVYMCTHKQRTGACQKATEVTLKEFPNVKAGIIWATK